MQLFCPTQNFTFALKFFMSKYFFFLILLMSELSKAQFCKEMPNNSLPNFQNFNSFFLQSKKIKKVNISYAVKEDAQRIKDLGISETLFLDSLGQVTKRLKIVKSDTSETFYYYQKNNLSIERSFHANEITSVYYNHDSLRNKTKEMHCKEENAGNSKAYFKLKRQDLVWSENYAYQQINAKQLHRKTFNDIGALYKEAILYTNEKGWITEENERFSVTGVSQNFKYNYDSAGNLVEKVFSTDVVGLLEEKSTFTYDSFGNILGEKFFRNGNLIQEKIYFYDAKNEILQAILTKYPDRKTIEMQNFQVEYF